LSFIFPSQYVGKVQVNFKMLRYGTDIGTIETKQKKRKEKQNRRKGKRNKTEEKIQTEASAVSPAPCVGECKEVRSRDWTLQLK
jgi:hypothetical protein